MEIHFSLAITVHQIHEAIRGLQDIIGFDGDIRGGVLNLHAAQGILGGDRIVLRDFQMEFFTRLEAEPSQTACVKLVPVPS